MNRTPARLSAALFAALFATTLITAALFAGCTSHDSATRGFTEEFVTMP